MDWIAGLLELISLHLIGSKKKCGFLTNVIANALWVISAIHFEMYGLLVVVIPAITLNIKNYWLWWKDEVHS
ncbi:MAG: hypothetical protein CMD96_05895 [Gammaproteobacteria bacterium]|nr:hypothetical protein [Gammaproteobacteria bacterium]|tara:strand:+ start:2696 stop:2911 length:216 start_codon:yes stop_codon:yes gene_type:complete